MVVTTSNRNSHLWLGCIYSIHEYIYTCIYRPFLTTVQIDDK